MTKPPRKKKPAPKTKLTVDFGKRARFGQDVPVFDRGSSRGSFRIDEFDDYELDKQDEQSALEGYPDKY